MAPFLSLRLTEFDLHVRHKHITGLGETDLAQVSVKWQKA